MAQHMDIWDAKESLAIMKATRVVGRDVANMAQRVALRQDLYIWNYNEATDTWQLSDGEIYTSDRIKVEYAEISET